MKYLKKSGKDSLYEILISSRSRIRFFLNIEYYEKREEGLGQDFAVEVYSPIEKILFYPKAWPIIEENIRRSLVNRFPHGILYAEYEDKIWLSGNSRGL